VKPVPPLDGRLAADISTELRRRALAFRGGAASAHPVGPIENAIYEIAGRIGEEITTRLDRVPDKQADNFYTAVGIGRDAAQAAIMPVSFKLVDSAENSISAPAGTQLMVNADEPVVFETSRQIDLVPGKIATLRGIDASKDAVFLPAETVLTMKLPRSAVAKRSLRSGAAAGASIIQINPAAGLEKDMLLAIGNGNTAQHHIIIKVEDELVTIAPPLEVDVPTDALVMEVTEFAPFEPSSRNHQRHTLYLGHDSLLDTSEAIVTQLNGVSAPEDAVWSWWGSLSDDIPPGWLPFMHDQGLLRKVSGKAVKTEVNGTESYWMRAAVPKQSLAAITQQRITLSLAGPNCTHGKPNEGDPAITYEAFAANAPAVVNKPYHPFGREPRILDTFQIGCKEAFAKAGAEVVLDFKLGGAEFGPLAGAELDGTAEFFSVGSDGLLYRIQVSDFNMAIAPLLLKDDISLVPQSLITLSQMGSTLTIAVCGEEAVKVGSLQYGAPLIPDQINWTSIPFPDGIKARDIQINSLLHDGNLLLYILNHDTTGKQKNRLFTWSFGASIFTKVDEVAVALIPVGAANGLFIVTEDTQNDIRTWKYIGATSGQNFSIKAKASTSLGKISLSRITSWSTGGWEQEISIAGFEDGELILLKISGSPANPSIEEIYRNKDIAADGISTGDKLALVSDPQEMPQPSLIIAGETLKWLIPYESDYVLLDDTQRIGAITEDSRQFASVGSWLAVPHEDSGLMARRLSPGSVFERLALSIKTSKPVLLASAQIAGNIFAVQEDGPDNKPIFFQFTLSENGDGLYHANAFLGADAGPASITPAWASQLKLLSHDDGKEGTIKVDAQDDSIFELKRTSSGWIKWSDDEDELIVAIASSSNQQNPHAIIRLVPGSDDDKKKWKVDGTIPSDLDGQKFQCLKDGAPPEIKLLDRLEIAPDEALDFFENHVRQLRFSPLVRSDFRMAPAIVSEGKNFLLVPEGVQSSGALQLVSSSSAWRHVGPDVPANPKLSWEYWNGSGWWALNPDNMQDETADFQKTGKIYFTVPHDIAESEISGRINHWIRARLVGGDYGEAQIEVTSSGPVNGVVTQSTKRDLSTVRAPYIVMLSIGYCVVQPVTPQYIYTEDSLGFVDRTSANDAGLAFPAFSPVSDLMNPIDRSLAIATIRQEDAQCDDPCDIPGALEDCSNICSDKARAKPAEKQAVKAFTRGILIAFDKPFSGDGISLYIDAEPTGRPVELEAAILHNGLYKTVRILSDHSLGLSEAGIITLSLPMEPDLATMLGTTGYWLRLGPKRDGSKWSPRLHSVALNAVQSRSVETRKMERLGASSGLADQIFRLAEAPIDSASLVLRVNENLSHAERKRVEPVTYPDGPEGEWVVWQQVKSFSAYAQNLRQYRLDPASGDIRFSDGINARIPPLGAEIIAESYGRLKGRIANGVAPGAKPILLSPLANVDSITALDHSAGGCDMEPELQARLRASAKLRHGGRLVTLDDLREFVPTLDPSIAQAAVYRTKGEIRIVVILDGAEPRPTPALLRAVAAAVRNNAGYGIRHDGALKLLPPRLMPFGVSLMLEMPDISLLSEASTRVRILLGQFFHAKTGGYEGNGWPVGRLPEQEDIAAALTGMAAITFPVGIGMRRTNLDKGQGDGLPCKLPPDVLARLDLQAVDVDLAGEGRP
jgi:Baseplate J-like protein